MTLATSLRGRTGEALAAQYLERNGWTILKRNFRSRRAELDLIGLDGQTLVFLEVKQRSTKELGAPEEAVDARKIARLYHAANCFLKVCPQYAGRDCRFDVMAIDGVGPDARVRHLKDVICR